MACATARADAGGRACRRRGSAGDGRRGGAPLWRQILADVLGAAIVTTSSAEGAAQGAATLAAVGTGWFDTVQDACRGSSGSASPPSHRRILSAYVGAYARYRDLYPALAPTFHSFGRTTG